MYRRTLASLFGLREARRGVWDYRISVGVVEVYNEAAFDLLNNDRRSVLLLCREISPLPPAELLPPVSAPSLIARV